MTGVATLRTAVVIVPTVGREISARPDRAMPPEKTGFMASIALCHASAIQTTPKCKLIDFSSNVIS